MHRRHALLAVGIAVVWGVNFVGIAIGLRDFPPLLFAALRFLATAFPAVLIVPRPRVRLRWLVAVGAFLGGGQFALLFLGIGQGVPAGLASLVLQLQAVFTLGFAVTLLGERPRPAQLAGGALALAGVGVIAAGRAESLPLAALGLVVLAAASWGAGNVSVRRARSDSALGLVVWSALVPPVPLVVLSLLVEGRDADVRALTELTVSGVLALGYVVVVSTFFGIVAWAFLLGLYPATQVAPFSLLVPVVGILAAWLVLGEEPTGVAVVGAGVVLAGLALTVRPPRPGCAAAPWVTGRR